MILQDKELDETLYALATLIAAYSNPHIFFDLKTLPPEEIQSELDALKNIMKEMIG